MSGMSGMTEQSNQLEQPEQPPMLASRLRFFGTGRHPARQIVTGSRTYEVVCPVLSTRAEEQAGQARR